MHVLRADAPKLFPLREIIQEAFNYIIKAREKVLGGAGCRCLSVNECRDGWFIKRKTGYVSERVTVEMKVVTAIVGAL